MRRTTRSRVWNGIQSTSLVFALTAGTALAAQAPDGAVGQFIVQGHDVAAARESVEHVGGRISHELKIIKAVGARLTSEQLEKLRTIPGVRVSADVGVSVDSTDSGSEVALDDKKLFWVLGNDSERPRSITRIDLSWPGPNGPLKKVKLDGDEIWGGGEVVSPTVLEHSWHDDSRRRQIAAGASVDLMLEFVEVAALDQYRYAATVTFDDGSSTEFVPNDCQLAGASGDRKFDGKKIEWVLSNLGGSAATVRSVASSWPHMNGALEKIKLGGDEIFKGSREAPVTTVVDGWHHDVDRRRIKAGGSDKLTLEFGSDIELDQEAYAIVVEFAEGCVVEFEAQSLFEATAKTDKKARPTFFPSLVGADKLHEEGVTGSGVTVAILDTGLWSSGGGKDWVAENAAGDKRTIAYNAITDEAGGVSKVEDKHGHGTHLASVIASNRKVRDGNIGVKANGVAPDASLVVVKAFDDEGNGSYLDVIRGIDWIVQHRHVYDIRVLNLSFSAPPRSYYWDDPLNQAVMAAWQAGIVVVASAGNLGPSPMSIGVPANVPYVVSVGAMTDNRTPGELIDDRLTSFSSAGPTYEAFVKPEVIAPGGRILGIMNGKGKIAKQHPNFHDGDAYYYMSGTSQSAAIVSAVAALILQHEPHLTPDQVKCKLMSGARPAVDAEGRLAYSVFQQGAGLVDAYAAAHGNNYDCANVGLDVGADLAGLSHFRGPANRREDGSYYIEGVEDGEADGYIWSDGFLWSDGYLWSNAYLWNNGYLWSNAYLWNNGYLWSNAYLWNNGYLWSNAYLWNNGYLWSNAYLWNNGSPRKDEQSDPSVSINVWVPQE